MFVGSTYKRITIVFVHNFHFDLGTGSDDELRKSPKAPRTASSDWAEADARHAIAADVRYRRAHRAIAYRNQPPRPPTWPHELDANAGSDGCRCTLTTRFALGAVGTVFASGGGASSGSALASANGFKPCLSFSCRANASSERWMSSRRSGIGDFEARRTTERCFWRLKSSKPRIRQDGGLHKPVHEQREPEEERHHARKVDQQCGIGSRLVGAKHAPQRAMGTAVPLTIFFAGYFCAFGRRDHPRLS